VSNYTDDFDLDYGSSDDQYDHGSDSASNGKENYLFFGDGNDFTTVNATAPFNDNLRVPGEAGQDAVTGTETNTAIMSDHGHAMSAGDTTNRDRPPIAPPRFPRSQGPPVLLRALVWSLL
jgi:hypothetical protein